MVIIIITMINDHLNHIGPRELVQMLTIGMGWNEDDHHGHHLNNHLDTREVEPVQV